VERPQRDFKGIWIPKEVWLSEQLTLMEKVLFVEIHSLDNERGCFASNRYFADFFGISDRQIRNVILGLKTKGFVTVTVRNKNERVIRAAGKYRRVSPAAVTELVKNSKQELLRKWRMDSSGRVGRKFPGR
jgi:hypothetical protein